MQVFQVGGSVRDKLMNKPSQDRDWVVVGSTPEEMLAMGYVQVGADFPVFLHPQSNDEYALARTERANGKGYHAFTVDTRGVTLEQDLMRRDLTINAMAEDAEGRLIDPYGGQRDLRHKVLRHVGPAFREDPVRVLRILRFLARFGPGWSIDISTLGLMLAMKADGLLHHLTPERVWKEVSRALMEPHAVLFLQGAWALRLHELPSFSAYAQAPAADETALRTACEQGASLEARFCLAFAQELTSEEPAFGSEIPRDVQQAVHSYRVLASLPGTDADEVFEALEHSQGIRDGRAFGAACEALGFQRPVLSEILKAAQRAALTVDIRAISASMPPGPAVGRAIRSARLAAVRHLLDTSSP